MIADTADAIASTEAAAVEEPAAPAEDKAEEPAAPVEAEVAAPAPVDTNYYDSISLYGYTSDFRIGTEDATVTYPADIIYVSDLQAFADYALPKYSPYLVGVEISVGDGKIDIDHPYVLSARDQETVFNVMKSEIESYLAYYIASLEKVEEPVAEEPADPAPEAEPSVSAPASQI